MIKIGKESKQKICKYFFVVLCLTNLIFAAPVNVSVSFDAKVNGSSVYPEQLNGTSLSIYNLKSIFSSIDKGLSSGKYQLFRFPNGSMSNDYHWNGNGNYDIYGIWTTDTAVYKSGFTSLIKYRGTSKNHYGQEAYSLITDNDTATFWWSGPLITDTKPYAYLYFSEKVKADSICIYWGDIYGVDYTIDYWSDNIDFPGPHQAYEDAWRPLKTISGNAQKRYISTLDSSIAFQCLRVRTTQSSNHDSGVQLAEIYLYKTQVQITKNCKHYAYDDSSQTRVIATSNHSGNIKRSPTVPDWDFESFMAYLDSFHYDASPIICVNYSTGLPEEAAQWVHYANKKKGYNIRFWQIGNEMDGFWEEGGPVSAKMYAERYYLFAKAMKNVDPTIKIFGPVLSYADFTGRASGDYNDLCWMETFLKVMGEKEKADGVKYVDGVDFHSYPYYFTDKPIEKEMISTFDLVYDNADTLLSWINRYLGNPDSVLVSLSEYNSSVVTSDMMMKPINGIYIANMYAGFAEKFSYRGLSVVWESFVSLTEGPDNTFGALSLFSNTKKSLFCSIKRPPTSTFWGMYLSGNIWLQPGTKPRVIKGNYSRDGNKFRAYGVKDTNCCNLLFVSTTDSLNLQVSLTGADFDTVDLYSWSANNFRWIGTDQNAYAMPNCGPTSKRINVADFSSIILQPYTIAVARYHNISNSDAKPELIISGAYPTSLNTNDTLRIWGTAKSNGGIIKGIFYSINENELTSTTPVDQEFDGPMESYFTLIPAEKLKPQKNALIIYTIDSKGDTITDTITYTNNSVAVKNALPSPHQLKLQVYECGKSVTFSWPVLPENPTARLSVFNNQGKRIYISEPLHKKAFYKLYRQTQKMIPGVYIAELKAGRTALRSSFVIR